MSSAAPLATSTGLHLDRRQLLLQRGDVLVELVGERGAALGGVLLEQQVLQPVPTGERRIVDVGEVVDAGVGLAVGVLDEPGDRLDALPRHARRRVRVLRGLQIARPHRVGEHLDDPDELVGLADGVPLVVVGRLLKLRAGVRPPTWSRPNSTYCSLRCCPNRCWSNRLGPRPPPQVTRARLRCSFIQPPRSRRVNVTLFYPRKGRHT